MNNWTIDILDLFVLHIKTVQFLPTYASSFRFVQYQGKFGNPLCCICHFKADHNFLKCRFLQNYQNNLDHRGKYSYH